MSGKAVSQSPREFVRTSLVVTDMPEFGGLRLYTAHPGSGLWRLRTAAERVDAAPYWAYVWAGGAALARHIEEIPQSVAGKRVLDVGTGCGIVAIAAAKAGARQVTAIDIDPYAVAAAELNADLNGMAITAVGADVLDLPVLDWDVVLAGDLFYDRSVAERASAFLSRCVAAGTVVLVGDPRRAHLPGDRLELVAEYEVEDVGGLAPGAKSGVFAFKRTTLRACPSGA